MTVNMNAQPQQIAPGESSVIRVEVLSGPDSPIADADVTFRVGGGSFTASGGLDVNGTTNSAGFFAAEWQCPPSAPSPYGYYITANVEKAGYEPTAKRIIVSIS